MPQIEFRENKVLKLTNVLSRKVPENEIFNQGKQIQMLMNWIQAKGYKNVGPLIMYNSGVRGIDTDNKPIIESRIMIQLQNNDVRLEVPYRFDKEIKISNCLLARFNDNYEKIQFATQKLTLFAYENDLELTGETYIIVLQNKDNNVLSDVFMPIKQD